jgi:hypothetical protein
MIGGLITASGYGWQQFITGSVNQTPVVPVGQAPVAQKQQKGGLKKRTYKRKHNKRK